MMSTGMPQKYLDAKTIERIKRLDVRARLVVEGFVTGQHRSPYHGFAIEFAGHREYAPGDELKHIDWKVWSKTDRLYIKEYEEETNLKCTLLVDRSKSMNYGEKSTSKVKKFDYAATAAASLMYLMQQQQDAVGMVTFSTKVDKMVPPSTSPMQLKRVLAELEQTVPDQATDVSSLFPQLAGLVRQRGMVILVSDLLLDLKDLAEMLRQFRLRRHEVVVMQVLHEDEINFPFEDNSLFKGLESDVQLEADPRALRRSYLEILNNYLTEVKRLCASQNIDHVLLSTADPLDAALASYLTFRQKTRKRR